ncbi:type IV-A pilus assembly ATPase PilB [Marinospirillum alkaliphilum]|uniref:Type IV pilus assembly protein PilB n=1 Tax=Marinospirillum alkaliphilum DSM 21637 TaxID=1122209 RepID=A0A1K1TVY7_9GAMM|nr:type IV-A pilus assembly ATPase PilB [Marinospirillum alkaliphilum]SFX04211.1 type IV pilus assembly protein PilB [Marinospirillum alkaliphilum DSM 21637]
MVDTSNPNVMSSLSRRLVREGLMDEGEALSAQADARNKNEPFIHYLASTGRIEPDLLASVVAEEFGLPYLDLDAFDPKQFPKKLVDEKLLRKHQVMPLLVRGNILSLGMSTPTNLAAMDEIQFQSGLIIHPVIVAEDKLHSVLESSLETDIAALGDLDGDDLAGLEVTEDQLPDDETVGAEGGAEDAPIVKFVNKVLLDAMRKGASDIHFEPFEHSYRIRFRIDGMLHEVTRPPLSLRGRLAARLKVMAKMNISERRIPQDGAIKLRLSQTRTIDFRVNTLPTLWGEKIVLRILDASSTKIGIEQLGFEPEQQRLYEEALSHPQGMILVTGPTGSGKTVTLYTGLNILNIPERNISSAEDPVEINMEGINQVNVNPKVGLDFATALRAFLRQDPDVVMVGEIRDLETAEVAVKAAQTGHLVLSTLHTNSASATLNRLMNMGVPPYNLAASVQLIIAQRLARKLCPRCKIPDETPADVLESIGFTPAQLEGRTLYKAVGCSHCTNGYKGRVGIYETVKITPELADMIMHGAGALDLNRKARELGFDDLRMSGRKKVLAGTTSLAELTRVTME